MAQLKDTLIQGSARVTDTLYTTNIAGGTITAPIYWTGGNVALPEKTSAEYFLAIDAFANGGKTYWVSKANVLNSIGAATSGHNHNSLYVKLDGTSTMTGALNIKPASGEGGELHLCASTANTTEAGIVLDHYANSLRIFGIASADGTTKTGTGTPLVIDPYAKTITGGYTITGALTGHASSDLALTGGKMTGRIYREGASTNWNKGRDNALIATSSINDYSPVVSIKTTNGSWDIGAYNNASYTDDLLFSYVTDTVYSGSSAVITKQIKFLENGHIVATLDGNASNVTGTVTYQHGGTGLTTLGSAGQVLKVNSSANGIEWGTVSTSDEKVKVAANITTAADYPVVFANSNKSTTAAETAGLNKSGTKFYFNPSTGLLTATQVANAIWNDYAEYRKQLYTIQPGYVIKDTDSGYIVKANERLIPGAQIVSDTWGHSMGKTNECQTPVAVAGRVLAYTYRPREQYHAGMAVCSAPGGTIDIMTREEIRDYPDAIIGIVSEIPDYEEWGSGKVKVDGRIWIKVR